MLDAGFGQRHLPICIKVLAWLDNFQLDCLVEAAVFYSILFDYLFSRHLLAHIPASLRTLDRVPHVSLVGQLEVRKASLPERVEAPAGPPATLIFRPLQLGLLDVLAAEWFTRGPDRLLKARRAFLLAAARRGRPDNLLLALHCVTDIRLRLDHDAWWLAVQVRTSGELLVARICHCIGVVLLKLPPELIAPIPSQCLERLLVCQLLPFGN